VGDFFWATYIRFRLQSYIRFSIAIEVLRGGLYRMAKRPLMISVDDVDREMWKECAEKSGLSLAEWVRRRCNGEGHAVEDDGVIRRQESKAAEATEAHNLATGTENPVAVAFRNMAAKRHEKPGKEYFEHCQHGLVKAGCARCKANESR
jgi:hypothetical protein